VEAQQENNKHKKIKNKAGLFMYSQTNNPINPVASYALNSKPNHSFSILGKYLSVAPCSHSKRTIHIVS
jgi:hypothetical protein